MQHESTNEWHEYGTENVAAEVDQRLQLMQEYVALDREHKRLNYQRKEIEDKSQKIASELRRVGEQLRSALGFDESVDAMKKSLDGMYGGAR